MIPWFSIATLCQMNILVLMRLIIVMIGNVMMMIVNFMSMKISMLETRFDSQKFVLGIGIDQVRHLNTPSMKHPWFLAILNIFTQIIAIFLLYVYFWRQFLVQMDM